MINSLQGMPVRDRSKVNLSDSSELFYWCRALNCTPQQLKNAVNQAGNSTNAIREQLKRKN
jgi:hypothetical protein